MVGIFDLMEQGTCHVGVNVVVFEAYCMVTGGLCTLEADKPSSMVATEGDHCSELSSAFHPGFTCELIGFI